MIIEFKNIASHLGTRSAGAAIRENFVSVIRDGGFVIFDFEGVITVSNSFADECFAKLLLHFDMKNIKMHTTFKNTSPFISSVIANSFRARVNRLVQGEARH